jgi:hypothetical protein
MGEIVIGWADLGYDTYTIELINLMTMIDIHREIYERKDFKNPA